MKTQLIAWMILTLVPHFLIAQVNGYNPSAVKSAEETIEAFKEKDAKFHAYFNDSYGFVVFPTVGKGGIAIGGAHGAGTVYELGVDIGKAKITQLTLGFQFGGQAYSQIIFFETEEDLQRFKDNKLEFAAQASAVALTTGAGANLAYNDGVAVFTNTKGGLMYEATLGGQKLKYKPYEAID